MIKAYDVELENRHVSRIKKTTTILAYEAGKAAKIAERENPAFKAVMVSLSESAKVKLG